MTMMQVLRMGFEFLREFTFGKRPTAEYLRKHPFTRTLLVLFFIFFITFIYLAENAMVVANVAEKKIKMVAEKEAAIVEKQEKIDDLKTVIADLKAKYSQYPHQERFLICDPNAEADNIDSCAQ